jgi:hypothetical protein
MGEMSKINRILVRDVKARDYLEDIGVDGRLITEWRPWRNRVESY